MTIRSHLRGQCDKLSLSEFTWGHLVTYFDNNKSSALLIDDNKKKLAVNWGLTE